MDSWFEYLHGDCVAAKSVEDVGGAGEVEHELLGSGVRDALGLAVDERGDGEVPCGVGGHAEAQEGPDPVVVEGRDEDGGGAAGAEDVRPCPLVQPVVDVVDVTDDQTTTNQIKTIVDPRR